MGQGKYSHQNENELSYYEQKRGSIPAEYGTNLFPRLIPRGNQLATIAWLVRPLSERKASLKTDCIKV